MMPLRGGLAPLTLATRTATANGLLTNLIGYWALDEAGGANNALDKHTNALTLTHENSPGSEAGLVYAGARAFVPASQQAFIRANEPLLQGGDVDLTVVAWVRPAVINAYMGICCKRGLATLIGLEYGLRQWNDGTFQFSVSNTDHAYIEVHSTDKATADQWIMVTGWHDAVADQVGVAVNANAAVTGAWTTGIKVATNQLYVGHSFVSASQFFSGRIGPVAIWRSAAGGGGVLTAAQRTVLYAAGAGLAYSAFTN